MSTESSVNVDDVKALMISHIDNAGISRVKVIPNDGVQSALRKGSTVSLSLGMLLAIDDHATVTDAIDPTIGDLRGIPDRAALAMIDPARGLAWAPSDLYTLDGEPHPTCQRSALRRVVADAKSDGFDFLVGIELEFTLFRGSKGDPVLAHEGPGYGTLPFLELEAWHLDLLEALRIARVPVEQLHPEYESGQIEISLAPRDPVRAVDDYVLARLIATRVSQQHGFLVSFAPVVVFGGVSNGCHIHLSANKGSGNIFYDDARSSGMSEDAEHMVGGVVSHLSEGLSLLGGSTLSFERLKPHNWAGAFACWGPGNREAAVRYMRGFAGHGSEQSNIEVKCVDPAANHYLATAALIGSAMDGVKRKTQLPAAVRVDPAELTDDERSRMSVKAFRSTLGESLQDLAQSHFFRELFGPMLIDAYLAVRSHDWETFKDVPGEEAVKRVRWRY